MVLRLLAEHRVLLVLDELEHIDLGQRLQCGAASMLLTRRDALPGQAALRLSPADIGKPGSPETAEQRALWEAFTVCRPDQAPIELAEAIAGVPSGVSDELTELRLIDALDERSCRVNWPAPLGLRETQLRQRHAHLISHRLSASVAEARAALTWACDADWALASRLGEEIFKYLRTAARIEASLSILTELESAAERHGDSGMVQFVRYERSWISSGSPITITGPVEQLAFDFSV